MRHFLPEGLKLALIFWSADSVLPNFPGKLFILDPLLEMRQRACNLCSAQGPVVL
jgi:hypothetical protein